MLQLVDAQLSWSLSPVCCIYPSGWRTDHPRTGRGVKTQNPRTIYSTWKAAAKVYSYTLRSSTCEQCPYACKYWTPCGAPCEYPPLSIIQCIDEARQRPTNQRRWRAEDLTWSVHRECPELDRAARASAKSFNIFHIDYLPPLSSGTFCSRSLRLLWGRSGHALGAMGGRFSTRVAD